MKKILLFVPLFVLILIFSSCDLIEANEKRREQDKIDRIRREFVQDSIKKANLKRVAEAQAKLMASLPYPESGFPSEAAISFLKGMSNYRLIEVRDAHRKAAKKSYYKVVKVGDAWEVRWAYKNGRYSVESYFNKRKADLAVNDKIEGRKRELNSIALIINSRKED